MTFVYNTHSIEYEYSNIRAQHTLLLLHGWGGNKDSFAKIKKIFKSRYNILSLSLPPFDDTIISLSMYEYRDIVLNLLMLHNIDKTIIICHSFGLRVSLMLATSNLVIEKIIITGGAGIRINPSLFRKLSNQFNQIFIRLNPSFFDKIASDDYKALSYTNRQTFKRVVNKDLTNYVKLLHCPIFLFWGDNDTATPIRMFKIFKKLQPRAQFEIIKNGTHFCYLEQSELFVDCCENFLAN